MKKVLVTGDLGFIGHHLVMDLLSEGYSVVGVDRRDDDISDKRRDHIQSTARETASNYFHWNIDLLNSDMLDSLIGNVSNIDAVVHLAAMAGVLPSFYKKEEYFKNNIGASRSLLDIFHQKGLSPIFLYASSSSVYGKGMGSRAARETDPLLPESPYALTKVWTEELFDLYSRVFGHYVVGIRPFTVYGPSQRDDLLLKKWAKKVSAGEVPELYGSFDKTRDLTYVGDVARALIKILETCSEDSDKIYNGRKYNVASGAPISLSQIYETMKDIFGHFGVKRSEAKEGDLDHTHADISLIKEEMGWTPEQPFKDGILKMMSDDGIH